MGMPICAGIYFWYVIFHGYCLGATVENVDFIVFLVFKVQLSFGLCLANVKKIIK